MLLQVYLLAGLIGTELRIIALTYNLWKGGCTPPSPHKRSSGGQSERLVFDKALTFSPFISKFIRAAQRIV